MNTNMITQEILSIFRKHGHIEYGERCSMLSHSVQAGLLAKAKDYDVELIAAAFLHDIGHLAPLEFADSAQVTTMGSYGLDAHDHWGEDYLRSRGFSDRIIATVRNHVAAKRYLCFADDTYYQQLSNASQETLRYQGGPMSMEEAKTFEADPFFEDSILIRKIDDEAKEVNFEVSETAMDYLETILDKVLPNG
ncbi:HD domain-containing protein [Haliscomenobacter sp.]|uniref:HD domain-containing protein n=1 Tax=Haliscomenobacter sp. TaxID=2717303 RepID=UPI0033651BFE